MSLVKKLKDIEIEFSCKTYKTLFDLIIKGNLGGSPGENHSYWNNLTHSEKMDLTWNSIALETIYGLGYFGLALKIFSPDGFVSQFLGQNTNELGYLSLAGYGLLNLGSAGARTFWAKDLSEPIGSIKWEFLFDIYKKSKDGLEFYKEEIKKIIS